MKTQVIYLDPLESRYWEVREEDNDLTNLLIHLYIAFG